MNKEQVKKALGELKGNPSRKFKQSYDLIVNLKNIIIKQDPVDLFLTLPSSKGKKMKIAAFIDQQLADNAEKNVDLAIKDNDFEKYANNKSEIKKLAENYDYFIAQANLMPKVASIFGKILGTKGKMPNPKLGCVVPPNANLEPLVKKLNLTVKLSAKKGSNVQCMVGKEDQNEEEVINNVLAVYNHLLKNLPNEKQNIKNAYLKLTMSKPVKI